MSSAQIPNNLGATLLIVAALLLLPLGVGLPLLLLALARLRRMDGTAAFPRLQLACQAVAQPRLLLQKREALPAASSGAP